MRAEVIVKKCNLFGKTVFFNALTAKTTTPTMLAVMAPTMLAVMAALLVSACSTENTLQGVFGTSAVSPVFYGCKTPAEGEVEFYFSSAVKVASLYTDPPLETEIVSQGETVKARFSSTLPGGSKIAADILVEDNSKNTLNVLVTFRTRNNRVPGMLINEVRTAYSKPKVEFVEIRILKAGNLGGVRLFAAYSSDEPVYEFPPVEVKAGEYIVVHTRSMEEGLVDETGTSLAKSGGTDSSANARDFWRPEALKLHGTNVIYLLDQDDVALNGLTLIHDSYKWTDKVAAAAEFLVAQKAWKGSRPEDAVDANGNTATRTICRTTGANTNSAADWYIAATSCATPGTANNPKRYK